MYKLFVAVLMLAGAACGGDAGAWRPRERWRGFNLEGKAIKGKFSGEWRESDLAMMHELGFNFARIMIDHRYWCKDDDWTQPDPAKFGPIDEVIAWGKKHQIHIQICFSFPPGIDVNTKSKKALFTDPVAHRALATHWAYFARRYKGIPNDELSFNLFNEPGLQWGRNPELAAIQMPVGQSHHAYVPMSVTHYKASWIAGSQKWAVPIWPPYPVSGPIFGARKPASHQAPIVVRDVPACELTLRTGVFNREVELIVEADGKRLFARHYVPSPKESCWTNLVLRPGGTEWGGCLKEPVRVGVPACERLSVRMGRGDWLELKALEIAAGGRKASLPFSSEWSTPLRQEMRFAGFGASSPFVPLDGKHYTGDDYLDACKNAAWKPVFDAGQFVMVGEFGVYNKTPHDVALRWMEDNLRRWKKKGIGWALWNFRGPFGILDSTREDVQYEDFHGHKLDRKMLELLQRY